MSTTTRLAGALLLLIGLQPAVAAPGPLCRRDCNDAQRACKAAVKTELAALQALCPADKEARRQCRHDARIAVQPHRDECRATGRACRACCKDECGSTTSSTTTTPTTSSSTTSTTSDHCGNGVLDAGETCDSTATPNGCFLDTPNCNPECTGCVAAPTCTQLALKTVAGTPYCGFPGVRDAALAPFSGELHNAADTVVMPGQLGLSCLYMGGGLAAIVPPMAIPAGGETVFDVLGDCRQPGPALGPADTGDPRTCSLGPRTTRHCVNGHPGTDGSGACTQTSDCYPLCVSGQCVNGTPGEGPGGTCADDTQCGISGAGPVDVCMPDAACFFGPPAPIPNGPTSICAMNVVGDGATGNAYVKSGNISMTLPLRSRLYLTGTTFGVDQACPICSDGTCNGGARAGQACTSASPGGTTIDCPPPAHLFLGELDLRFELFNTGEYFFWAGGGSFCGEPQPHPGAFGRDDVTQIIERGRSALGGFDPAPREVALVGATCIPPIGSTLFDLALDLPGPAAMSVAATVELR